jgi:hypothetical protein
MQRIDSLCHIKFNGDSEEDLELYQNTQTISNFKIEKKGKEITISWSPVPDLIEIPRTKKEI